MFKPLLLAFTLIAASATAQPVRPIVVELFTSQGCNSCPPADALLGEIVRDRPDVLALAFHVTYWNNLGWPDPFSFKGATDRQAGYNRLGRYGGSYTPQMVVDGHIDVVGSNRAGVAAAIKSATSSAVAAPMPRLTRDGAGITIDIPAGPGTGRILLVGYDREHRTIVPRGENAGSTLVEANIVREFVTIGDWTGTALQLRHPVPKGERLAVLIQSIDGRYLAVGRE